MSQQDLFDAIVEDDRPKVKKLLRANPGLARNELTEARLYRSKIMHWLYVGDTALHLAVAGHRAEIAALLLAAGADPNAAGNHRASTPLHYAADGCPGRAEFEPDRQVATIRCLLAAGAAIQAQDKNGATPLHRAVRTRCAAAVRCLLEAGSDPTLKNQPGSTPFHLAVQNTGRGGSGSAAAKAAQAEIIREFLKLGVNPNLKDGSGNSVLECARTSWVRDLFRA